MLEIPKEIQDVFDKYDEILTHKCQELSFDAPFSEYNRIHQEVYSTPEYVEALNKWREYKRDTMDFKVEVLDLNEELIGDMMSMKDFKACVEAGGFIDDDGYGEYMLSPTELTNIVISPSDVKRKMERKDMPYVMWYNR